MKFNEKEFILGTAKKIAQAAKDGDYEFNTIKLVDVSKPLTEDEIIDAVANIINKTSMIPKITKLPNKSIDGKTCYRVIT